MRRIAILSSLAIVLAVLSFASEKYTRGVGVYPGDPDQDSAPVMVPDTATYRNIALHRPAYHSNSYDYNLTAQLVTDGIKETAMPRWLVTSLSPTGVTNRIEREFLVDHNSFSNVNLKGPEGWMQFELAGGEAPLQIDRILPALFSDNFISLMPGEQRGIEIHIENADTRGERPTVVVRGFNISK